MYTYIFQENVVKKLQSAANKVKAVSELSDLHQSYSADLSTMEYIPFKVWSLSKFSKYVMGCDN